MDSRMLVIVKAGRADFADAAVDGILTAKGRQRAEQRRGADIAAREPGAPASVDWHAAARGVKVAIGRNLGADDYANMRFEAELEYGEPLYNETALHRAARRVLAVYGRLVLGVAAAYRAQDKVLEA